MTDAEMMWVHPAFKKKLKLEAVQNNKSILEHTKELASRDDLISKPVPDKLEPLKDKKKRGFQFGF